MKKNTIRKFNKDGSQSQEPFIFDIRNWIS